MYQFWYRLPNLRVKKSSLVQTINTFTNSGFRNYFGLWVLVITHTLKTINRVSLRPNEIGSITFIPPLDSEL